MNKHIVKLTTRVAKEAWERRSAGFRGGTCLIRRGDESTANCIFEPPQVISCFMCTSL